MAESSKSSLQSLLSGEPLPTLPAWDPQWDLRRYHLETERFHRQLLDYIRRLLGKLTGTNIFNEIINNVGITGTAVDWRYDTTTNRFQVKYLQANGTVSDWTDATGGQPVTITKVVRNLSYDTTTHLLEQDVTADVVVLEKGSDTEDEDITTAVPCGS